MADNTSSSSDESFINEVQEVRSGVLAYQFEPKRRDSDSSENSPQESSEGDEDSSGDEATDRLENLDWCLCARCSMEHVDRRKECLCCREKPSTRRFVCPSNTDNTTCVVNNGDFNTLCRTRPVLRNVLVALNNVRADQWNVTPPPPNNRGLRYAAYRQFTWWAHGKLGPGRRRVIPTNVTHAIREAFPKDPEEEYEGFHSVEDDSD